MIARFDHRPRLTAALALATIVLLVVVVTLSTLLITAAPPTAPAQSDSVSDNTPAWVPSENYDQYYYYYYSHQPKPAQTGNGADLSAVDRHAAMVAAFNDNR